MRHGWKMGQWDCARRYLPLQRGFGFFYGFANTGIDYFTHERYGVPSMFSGDTRVKEEGYATDLFQRAALEFLSRQNNAPWFLYVAFNAPHAASSLEDKSVQAQRSYLDLYLPRDPKAPRTKYAACVTNMDDAIGAILGEVEKLGQTQNTLVVFHSDNGGSGPADNRPLRGRKSQLWEGGLRVPFVSRWPGHIPAGTVRDDLLTSLELFPTFCAAAGREPPEEVVLDGYDMSGVLKKGQPSPRREMFWQFREERAARIGSFKWIDGMKAKGLFDLTIDPGEKHDLSAEQPVRCSN